MFLRAKRLATTKQVASTSRFFHSQRHALTPLTIPANHQDVALKRPPPMQAQNHELEKKLCEARGIIAEIVYTNVIIPKHLHAKVDQHLLALKEYRLEEHKSSIKDSMTRLSDIFDTLNIHTQDNKPLMQEARKEANKLSKKVDAVTAIDTNSSTFLNGETAPDAGRKPDTSKGFRR